MRRQLKIIILFLVIITVITGVIYPLVITGIAQSFFNHQANGSLIQQNGRLSATSAFPYDASSSTGSNLGPSNPALKQAVQARLEALKAVDPANNQPVPVDLVTYSASGLDPDISVAAANYQIGRVARDRGLTTEVISSLVSQYTEGRQLGIFGEPRVNVLKLNLALDQLK
jgi:K+-transporting ATPase KdpC subunit